MSIPDSYMWSVNTPDVNGETLKFTLTLPKIYLKDLSKPVTVKEWYLTYKTVDEPQDLFKRLSEIVIMQHQKVIHRLVPSVWSTALFIEGKQFIKNRKESVFYIPLTHEGLVSVINQPVQILLMFKNYQKEHERCGILVHYSRQNTPKNVNHYWTFTNPLSIPLPTETKSEDDLKLKITLPWNGISMGQLVFFIPGANAWIKSGKIKSTDSDPVYEFNDPYESVVIDKLLNGMPLPKTSVFTCTFTNWQKDKTGNGLDVQQQPLVLELELENLPEDNRPKNASIEIFAVIGVANKNN